MGNTLSLIIDGNYLLHRCMRVPGMENLCTSTGKYTGGFYGFLNSLKGFTAYRPHRVFVVFDSGISKRRRLLYPPYKGSKYRDVSDPLYESMSPETKEYLNKFKRQRELLQFFLPHIGVRPVRIRGQEADDIIFLLSKSRISDIKNVISDDKDMLQLVTESCNVLRPMANQLVTQQSFYEKVGCSKEWLFVQRSISGDPSDGITGIPGVGKVTVELLSYQIDSDYIDGYPFDKILEYCGRSENKRIRKIKEYKDILIRNYELMSFDFAQSELDFVQMELEGIVQTEINPNPFKAKEYLESLEIKSIASNFDNFYKPFIDLY